MWSHYTLKLQGRRRATSGETTSASDSGRQGGERGGVTTEERNDLTPEGPATGDEG